jgi:PAS domain S-box-containing protein
MRRLVRNRRIVDKMTRYFQTAAFIVVLAVLYFCAGSFGLSLAHVHPSASAVWPPSGIALAAILLWGFRLWPGIFLGAFAVNLAAVGSVVTALSIAAGNTLEAILGATLVFRFANGLNAFEQTKNILKFILLAGILSTAVCALIGVTSLSFGGLAQWDDFFNIWLTWWLGDGVGNLIVGSLLVLWVSQPLLPLKAVQVLEVSALLLVLVLVGWLLFLTKIPTGLEYFALVPLLWAALRFGRRGAVTSAFAMSAVALWGTLRGFGPFVTSDPNQSLLMLQVFMATVTATSLVMASVILERRRLEQRLRIKDAVSRILADSPSMTDAAPKIIQVMCETAEWELGAIWNVDRSSNQLTCLDFWCLPSIKVGEFEAVTRQSNFPPGVGLPGRVWSSGRPEWITDLTNEGNFPRAPVATKEGLHAGIGFPIKLGDEVVGVMECFSHEIVEPDKDFLEMAGNIGSQLGQFMERKRAEDASRESERRLQVALAAGQMGAWEWNLSTNRVTWSSSLEAIHGLTPGTFGGSFEDFKRDIHPEDLELVLTQVEKTLATRGDYHVAYRIKRPDGVVRWVEGFGHILLGANGWPDKLAGVCMDITERKHAEETLRAKEAQVRLITDTAPVMLSQCSRDERFRFVNRMYAERLGLVPEQIVGKSITEILGKDAGRIIRPHIQTVLNGETVEYETEIPYERLGRRFMRAAYVPEKDASGNVTGWVSAISDITERKQTEEMLRQRTRSLEIVNQEFRKLIDTAPIGIAVATDAACEHIWCNPEFTRMLGTELGQNVSATGSAGDTLPFQMLHNGQPVVPDDLPMQRACREGIDILDEELEILRSDGTIIHELCRATPLREEDGKVRGCIGIFLNITDRKVAEEALQQAKDELARANEELEKRVQYRTAELQLANAALSKERDEEKRLEQQLRQAQKMESIGVLAGGIAHDFNNILNIIKGYTSLLRDHGPGNAEMTEDLNVIDEAIERGASTVRQLLAVAKESAVRFEQVDLNDALQQLKALLSGTLPRTINIGLDLDPGLASVLADPNQINQVLLNICVNARDAMPEGGELLLKTGTIAGAELRSQFRNVKEKTYACITVKDSGSGMEEVTKSRIFEPFFTTKEQGQGTGLGLSVAYGIVTNHAGFIDVTSEPGFGTTFRIYLPLADNQTNLVGLDRPRGRQEFGSIAVQGHVVLFVEDEIRQLELMRRTLEKAGYRVLVATDGVEAVETFLEHKNEISVVVLDLGLPKLNGWEALKKMRKADPTLKPILASGYISHDMESAMDQGELSALLMKPYQPNEIIEQVSLAVLKAAKFLNAAG